MAGDDEKSLKALGRYATPKDVWEKARNLEKKLSSGEYRQVSPYPADGKPDEQAAWRKEHGVPDAPDKYDLKGIEVDESSKPVVDSILGAVHQHNLTQDQGRAMVETYYSIQEQMAQQRAEKDRELAESLTAELAEKWGGDYRHNMNAIHGILGWTSQDVKAKIMNARLPDGTPVGSDPEIMDWLVSIALEVDPAGTVLPNVSGDKIGNVDDEISKIEAYMRKNRQAYNRDEAMQKKLRDLYGARERLTKRAG